ncbi:hypothetical protein [Oligosphaera ethanolica]|uniref:Uncharacterized protein n=1 Tax=Oligosphaera ethanolica TaxID=760260 RepID=A0AAE4ANF5_9BACT|nr:hypothetical protein [Oligosphaera ethanolica]MDQ0290259.1 hypothetical protein [Oligosphaera ethanolica]
MLKKMLMPLLLSAGLLAAQDVSTAIGNWQLTTGAGGNIAVSYAGKPLISGIGIAAFTPGWKQQRFNLQNAAMTRDGDIFTWHKQDQHADANLTLAFTDKTLRIALDMLAQPTGPVEFGIYIPPESMKTASGAIFLRGDGQSISINDEEVLSDRGHRTLALDLPDVRYTFTRTEGPFGFTLQDKRHTSLKNIRYIMSTPVGDEAKPIAATVELAVEDFAPDVVTKRQRFLRTPLRRVTAMTLPNAGFEDGQDTWAFGKTAALDRDSVHSGEQAACLTVNDPMTETVYITRQVPIIGGMAYDASCFVKTENVVAKPGKMSSVGAGLIVEWSDANGKWLAAGQYACDVFGTTDWQLKQCKGLRAPDDAGFASVFLALRGAGRAWFDDFSMRQIDISVDKISPEPDIVLATNTPFFTWSPLAGVSAYILELSRDEAFPATAATRRYELGVDASWQLRDPLPPGTWHWRVTSKGCTDVQPWSFTHAVPVGQDCLPPIITGRAWRVIAPDSSVAIVVSDESAQAPKLTATVGDGQAVTVSAPRSLGDNRFEYNLTLPAGWPRGLNTMQATATDPSGNRANQVLWLLHAPKPPDAVVIDADGNYNQNGQKIFPLGIYEVLPDDMPLIKGAGFEVVHTYRWEGSQDDVACREYLDACAANGLRAFIGFDRGVGSGNGMVQGNFEHLAKRVGALADHPGLFCWYLYDEPEIAKQYVSPALLTSLADLVRELDPYHPVVMTTWGNGMNKYRRTWDTHWTQSYAKPAEIVNTIASHRELLLHDSPITLLIHCYDRNQTKAFRAKQPVDPAQFAPDADWMRAAAFVGVVKSVNGLWWWWYASHQKQFYTVAHVPHAWDALCAVVKDIRDLRPLILAPGTTHAGTVEVKKAARVEWWAKTVNGKQTVIAVNTSEDDLEAVIPIPGQEPATMAFKRFEVKVINP